jgi:UDP-glucose 4-epimerase
MTDSPARTVVVTGCGGFIGRHVARGYASLGCRVVGIGHGPRDGAALANWGVSRWKASTVTLAELRSLADHPDIIIHCAGDSSVGASFADPENSMRRNVDSAAAVLDLARHMSKPPQVVMLSSAAVYGESERLPIAESAPARPMSPYGRGKAAVEQMCALYGLSHGIPVAILRFFSVYGLDLRKQLFWDACKKFARGNSEFGGTGVERRDWLHIDDAVALVMTAAEHASSAVPTFNGGSGVSLTVSNALAQLRGAWGESVPPLRFTGVARAGDPPGYEADISQAKALGWAPKRAFDTGIAEYASWAHSVLT